MPHKWDPRWGEGIAADMKQDFSYETISHGLKTWKCIALES